LFVRMTDTATVWRHRTGEIRLDRTRVMGILNVTPDSFSDGGHYLDPDQALPARFASTGRA